MSFLSEFSFRISAIYPHVRTDAFTPMFAELFKALVPTDNVMILIFPSKNLPIIEYNDLPPKNKVSIEPQYVGGAFLLDPYYLVAMKQGKTGFFSLNDIAPHGFKSSEYNRNYFRLSGISTECGYLIRIGKDQKRILNISLGNMSGNYTKKQLKQLAEITPAIKALANEHWNDGELESDNQMDLRQQLETALECFGNSVLTEREGQTVHMILHGYSSKAIAERLNISVETVKRHRNNAYTKLDLGTQGELFSLFINSLMNIGNYEDGDPLVSYHSKP
ncbi:MAG: LuxR family transcriptional regulator, partial [Gammaproteobacteria bacterium]|nr:LuxR family transcriptional regulator [Gammaproteobacteria bacterium]